MTPASNHVLSVVVFLQVDHVDRKRCHVKQLVAEYFAIPAPGPAAISARFNS
jgi:hypothetical protein